MTAVRRSDRNDEWWVDFRWKGRRIRTKSPLQTKRGAEQHERHLRRQFSEDEDHGMDPFAGPPPRFAEFAERWMRDYAAGQNRRATVIQKRSHLTNHLLPAFGSLPLDAITNKHIDGFVANKVATGLSPKTIRDLLGTLRCSLNVARDWNVLRSVPLFRSIRVPKRTYDHLSADEVDRLIDAAVPGYWRALITFMADTGVRFGEAAALPWSALRLESEVPVVTIGQSAFRGDVGPTKTGNVRTIPLTPRTREALAQFPETGVLVFQNQRGCAPRPDSTLKRLHRICDRARVRRVGWHVLRHTYATLLCQRGVPLPNVQALLGHTTITMTARYAHAVPNDVARWVYSALVKPKPQRDPSQSGHHMATKQFSALQLAHLDGKEETLRSENPAVVAGSIAGGP